MEVLSFLKHNELFQGLSEEQLILLLPFIHQETFLAHAVIFKEGDAQGDLYIIQEGTIEIFKRDEELGYDCLLTKLNAGEWFGEMAYFEMASRSASARALEKTKVFILSLENLSNIKNDDSIYRKITANLTKKMSHRLRNTSVIAVQALKQELRIAQTHAQMAELIIYLFVLFSLYFYSFKIFNQYAPHSWMVEIIPSFLIICFGLNAVWMVKHSKYPLEFYGLLWKNWKYNIQEALLFSLPLMVGMILVKWFLITSVPTFKQLPLFSLQTSFLPFLSPWWQTMVFVVSYAILAPVQEFIVRGYLQSCLQNFFQTSNRVVLAILTSNLLFGLFHGFKNLSFVAISFAYGVFWGWIYARQKSIVGPSVSHIVLGILGFGFLDYQSLLIY